jgi:general transcription factor 3C polypeptide 3 (transcription factor C subunit 4)
MEHDFVNYGHREGSFTRMQSSTRPGSAGGHRRSSSHTEISVGSDREESSGDDDSGVDNNIAYPFFRTADPALRAAYSYGDPRGGRYPDPTTLFPRPNIVFESGAPSDEDNHDESDKEENLDNEYIEVLRNDDPDNPDVDPDFVADVDEEETVPSPDHLVPTPSPRGTPNMRGRGRGRGTDRGRRGASTRGRAASSRRRPKPFQPPTGPRKYKPRAAAEMTPEFNRLNGLVSTLIQDNKFDEAYEYALEAIKMNPEHFPIHAMMAMILFHKKRDQDALNALCVGVYSTRETDSWWYVIMKLKEKGVDARGNETRETRQRLQECYSMLLDIDRNDVEARTGRMYNYLAGNQNTRAKNECLHLLKGDPCNATFLTHLAELCFTLEEPATALPSYQIFVDICIKNDHHQQTSLTWQLLDFYIDLLIQSERYEEALTRLRATSRWLLGRGAELYWDFQTDDREWDLDDDPRRLEVAEFIQGEHEENAYGAGLMIELRIKLALIRLGMGPEHYQEAIVGGFMFECRSQRLICQ